MFEIFIPYLKFSIWWCESTVICPTHLFGPSLCRAFRSRWTPRLQKRCLTLPTKTRWWFSSHRICMSRVLNYRHSFYSFSEDQIKLQDKKIGWEEFQIMIAPPPPPKAPTPHKEKFWWSEFWIYHVFVFYFYLFRALEPFLLGRTARYEPHGQHDTFNWKEGPTASHLVLMIVGEYKKLWWFLTARVESKAKSNWSCWEQGSKRGIAC